MGLGIFRTVWGADSLNVKCIGSWNVRGGYYSLVDRDYLYFSDVLCDGPDICVFNVSNPSTPTDIDANYNQDRGRPKNTGRWGESMFKKDSLLCVTGFIDSTVEIINVSNVVDTVFGVGLYKTPTGPCDVWASDSLAYIACGDTGLLILDISNPDSIFEVGVYNTPGFARGVDVSGNYAYVADHSSGLRAIDVSNPSTPNEVSFYDTPSRAYNVFVSGDYAYVADFKSGLQIINISNPDSIFGVGSCDTPHRARDIQVAGDYAYIADYEGGLRVIEVKDPSSPKEVGYYKHAPDPYCAYYAVYFAEPYVYITDCNAGIFILEFTPQGVEEQKPKATLQKPKLEIYPNPASIKTSIEFRVQSIESKDEKLSTFKSQPLTLKLHDITGREILSVFKGYLNPGTHSFPLDLTDIPSGVYFVNLKTQTLSEAKRLLVIK